MDAAEELCRAYEDAGRGDTPASNRAHALCIAEKAYRRTLMRRVEHERALSSSRSATVRDRNHDEG